ncbi:MAG: DUF6179 domain-containing protein [Porcipelethomonas sp.]
MNNIEFKLPFQEDDIDRLNYTESLLFCCAAADIIDRKRAEEIKGDLYSAFVETAGQFTGRESSTISRKRAGLISSSVLYWSDVYLMGAGSLREAVNILRSTPMHLILNRGREMIMKIHMQNIELFRKVHRTMLELDCYEYRYAIENSPDEYIRTYSARFDARSCGASIDYPLLDVPAYGLEAQGAVYINEYYSRLLLENEFCLNFDIRKLKLLLTEYGRIYKSDYRDFPFNIAEVAANNLLANALTGKKNFELCLTSKDAEQIARECSLMSVNTVTDELHHAFSPYQHVLKNDPVFHYVSAYIPEFAKRLCLYSKDMENLARFLVITAR